ncbi:ArsR family transcriptional regulator [Candidatus Woesearchaeota archaeon]|nr:MAG: ArsR family transcriptional regulator [Candidatus Woesearchaeota archaeon]
MKNILWYLLAGTRGGETRARILFALRERPRNAHQLAQELHCDYKTIQHHLRVLSDNHAVTAVNRESYGAVYFVSEEAQPYWNDFEEIWNRFGKSNKKEHAR